MAERTEGLPNLLQTPRKAGYSIHEESNSYIHRWRFLAWLFMVCPKESPTTRILEKQNSGKREARQEGIKDPRQDGLESNPDLGTRIE